MSARDVIAEALSYSIGRPRVTVRDTGLANFILSALTAAGYRIVPPGGLDAETELRKAVHAVQDATAAYLPPDGIDAKDCLIRVLQATDNPTINAITLGAQYGRP